MCANNGAHEMMLTRERHMCCNNVTGHLRMTGQKVFPLQDVLSSQEPTKVEVLMKRSILVFYGFVFKMKFY